MLRNFETRSQQKIHRQGSTMLRKYVLPAELHGTTTQQALKRRGSILVLSAVFIIVVFAFVTFTVDVGFMTLTKGELQTACDAGTHAAALELQSSLAFGSELTTTQAESAARQAAIDVAAFNPNGDQTSTHIDHVTDIRFGNRIWDPANASWLNTWGLVVGQLGVEWFGFVCDDNLKISGCHHLF
jgi:hypothetical protein